MLQILYQKRSNYRDLMSRESICIKVPKSYGEKTIILANELGLVNTGLEIQSDANFVRVPFARQPRKNELEKLRENMPQFEVLTHVFQEKKKRAKTLVELLEDKLPSHLLVSLPRAVDFVGDITIVEVPPELDEYKKVIGQAILKVHENVRTVLAKAGVVSGTYRVREFSVVAGESKTETIHKEYGCQYYVDLAKAYFSPRLSYEHQRVASLVKEGETVVDLFAGIGPFAVLFAKLHEDVKVYAVDVNPSAVEFLKRNVRLNRVDGKVHPVLGDARQVVKKRLAGVADRVIMNLPEKALEFVDVACEALKPEGGVVHFYSFVRESDLLKETKLHFVETAEKSGRRVEQFLYSRFVRETAPYEWQAVLDAKIR